MTTVANPNGNGKCLDSKYAPSNGVYGDDAPTPRKIYRDVVTQVADKARQALPDSGSRIDKAVAMVLAGDVELGDAGATVASASNPDARYTVNGACDCKDSRAPGGQCKHRIAYGIAKRAEPLAKARVEAELDGEATWVDTAKAQPRVNGQAPAIPAQFITQIHGKDFIKLEGLLAMAHDRGLESLTVSLLQADDTLAICEATCDLDGKHFTDIGDASPGNVNKAVAKHFIRCAASRAKARVLRSALGIGMCSVEEMD